MKVVWKKKTNTTKDLQNIKLQDDDVVIMKFNTTLLPNSILLQVKKIEGEIYEIPTFGKVSILSVLIEDSGKKTIIKFHVSKI